jgi:hypothetical protein
MHVGVSTSSFAAVAADVGLAVSFPHYTHHAPILRSHFRL